MQRKLPLQIPLTARDFRAIQTARNTHLDPFTAETQRRIHRLAHGTPERNALLQLQANRLRHQLRVQLRTVHFLNVDKHLALGLLCEIGLQLFDFRALTPDHNARPRGTNGDAQLVARAVDFNRTDPSRFQASRQGLLQRQIFMQQTRVVLLGEPARTPGLRDA